MKKNLRKLGIYALVITVLSSCKKDIIEDIYVAGNYEDGYFVTNEGNFGTGNGSISFVDEYGFIENDVFASVNSFALGDVVQSMSIINDHAYILVNNSSKIEVASIDSMISVATINVSQPRYMVKVSDEKAYVTDWGINGVQVIDLATNTISSSIACGTGPEGITVANGFAYVCNVGGWALDNTVSVINASTDVLETTLTVGDKPNSAVVDANGAVWVLTGGYTEYDAAWNVVSETAGNLVKIVGNTIEATYTFAVGNHPEDLVINDAGTTLYYSDGSWSKAVYSFQISDTDLSSIPVINKSFYGLGSANGYIYGTDAVDYTQQGWSFRYTENGSLVDSLQVGVIPGGYCFN
jgi:YVTN family beta-propeller protein